MVKSLARQADAEESLARRTFGMESAYFVALLIPYTVAHGGLLLILNAVYWDDWTVFGHRMATMLSRFETTGSVFNLRGYLHLAMLSAGPWLYRIATFALMFFSGVLLWKIIERHARINIDARYAIVLLFLVLPFYNARVALIDFPYTLQYFLFFLGWYLLDKSRPASLVLFFLSFETNSLLVFYALPMMEWYFRSGNKLDLKAGCSWGLRRIDYAVLPFAYWLIKTSHFRPFGVNKGYNESYVLQNLIVGPFMLAMDLMRLHMSIVLLVLALTLCLRHLKKVDFGGDDFHRRLLPCGMVALACALIPYWVVGAFPTFLVWTSRHQLLMPLGTALLLAWLLGRFLRTSRPAAFAFVVAASIAVNVEAYIEFHQDWSKQKELVTLMSRNDRIRDAALIVFDDRTANAGDRKYAFYEWNGLMRMAYGDETRFGLNAGGTAEYLQGKLDAYFNENYVAKDHVRRLNENSVIVRIDPVSRSSGILRSIEEFVRGEPRYLLTVAGI